MYSDIPTNGMGNIILQNLFTSKKKDLLRYAIICFPHVKENFRLFLFF